MAGWSLEFLVGEALPRHRDRHFDRSLGTLDYLPHECVNVVPALDSESVGPFDGRLETGLEFLLIKLLLDPPSWCVAARLRI